MAAGRRRGSLLVLLAMLVGLLGDPPAGAAPPGDEPRHPFVQGTALVGVRPEARATARRAIQARGGVVERYYAPGELFVVRTSGAVPAFVDGLRGEPGIRFAEPNYLFRAVDTVPDDPSWSSQWDMTQISMPAAWDRTTGSGDVLVAVIDTGVDYLHPDLAGQIWTNPGESGSDAQGRDRATNGVDDDGNGVVDDVHGADFANRDGDPMDDHDHGTHVAGTIAAVGNNGIGVAGMNWNVRIMALKFLDANGYGSALGAVEAIDYAIAKGADLSSNSWGDATYSQALRDAIARADEANQVFVAAAGNDSQDNDAWPFYPSGYELDNIVSVAATDQKDNLAYFSNYGANTVDVAAPGVGILSTVAGGGYATFSGTSMATPHVAGALALLLAAEPGLRTAPFPDVLHRLFANVDRVTSLSGRLVTGGRLNVAKMVAPDAVAPGACALVVTGVGRTSVSLAWTAPGDDGTTGTASRNDLSYRAAGEAEWSDAIAPPPVAGGGSQVQAVSALPPGTALQFRLRVTDDAGNASTCTVDATTTPGLVVFADGFEDQAFSSANWMATIDSWKMADEARHTGVRGVTDSPGRNSEDFYTVSLWTTDAFSLVGTTNPRLSFWNRYSIEPGFDFGRVEISTNGGSTWTRILEFTGHQNRWTPQEVSLAPYAASVNVKLRFSVAADWFVNYDGWRIDDIQVTADAGDVTAPAAPTGLAVIDPGTGRRLNLDWADSTEPDLAGYDVYRRAGSDPAWTKVAGALLTSSSFSDTGLVDGTTYTYVVKAVDTAGNVSDPSSEASGTPTDATPPQAPTGLTATAGDAVVALDWTDATETDLAGYHVYRRSGGGPWTRLTASVLAASAYADAAVTNGTSYDYYVTAVDTTGNESPPSPVVTASPHGIQTRSFTPTSVTISKGTNLTGSDQGTIVQRLGANDGSYLQVRSKKTNRYVTDWYATATIDVTGVTRLTIDYEGGFTTTVTQTLYVYDFATSSWVQLGASQTVGPTDVASTWSTASPAPYISPTGQVRLRVFGRNGTAFTNNADLVRVTVEY